MKTNNTSKSFADSLSTRCKNGLIGCLGDNDVICQPEKIAAGSKRLTLARNIGPRSIKEIALLLYEFYILMILMNGLGLACPI
jgi:hypothetical protein